MKIHSCVVLVSFALVLQAYGAPTSGKTPRGKEIYKNACASCHGDDIKKPGPLGPELFGSSKELLEAKVLNGTYPRGYKPKRPTNVMVRMPQFEKDLPALEAFLNAR